MKSKLFISEAVSNKDHKFGETTKYFPVRIKMIDGSTCDALFTKSQINDAIKRAENNEEDIPSKSFFEWLF